MMESSYVNPSVEIIGNLWMMAEVLDNGSFFSSVNVLFASGFFEYWDYSSVSIEVPKH